MRRRILQSTLLVVTHNPDLAALMPRRLRMVDGSTQVPDGVQRPSAGAAPANAAESAPPATEEASS